MYYRKNGNILLNFVSKELFSILENLVTSGRNLSFDQNIVAAM